MKLSILICTYNRADCVIKCLDHVEEALIFSKISDVEIIVVNNNSQDHTIEVINEWSKKSKFSLKLVTETIQGIAPARNRALREASGDLFICIDDDCYMHSNHIDETLKAYNLDNEPTMRYGAVYLGNKSDWPMTIHTSPHIQMWQLEDKNTSFPSMGNMIGCNFSMPKIIHDKVGCYDNLFGTKLIPGGEDADLGFRIFYAGFKMEYSPKIIVDHHHGRNTSSAVWKLIKGYQISAGALYAKYLFNHLHIKRIFLKRKPHGQANKDQSDKDLIEKSEKITQFHRQAKIYYFVGFYRYYKEILKKNLGRS